VQKTVIDCSKGENGKKKGKRWEEKPKEDEREVGDHRLKKGTESKKKGEESRGERDPDGIFVRWKGKENVWKKGAFPRRWRTTLFGEKRSTLGGMDRGGKGIKLSSKTIKKQNQQKGGKVA